MKLRSEGNEAGAKVIKNIIEKSSDDVHKNNCNTVNQNSNAQQKYTPDEAVSFIINNNLTKKQYLSMYYGAKERNFNIYPSYKQVLIAKKIAYPANITISEKMCEIPLQFILDHTSQRLLQALNLPDVNTPCEHEYLLTLKYGFDGSSGHSNYKQMWNEAKIEDESLFLTSIVPLQLKNINSGKIVWENPRLASTRFCRPIRLQWLRESDEISRQEKLFMDNQISNLMPYNQAGAKISYLVHLTMIDSKV
jgi:hypothetical protein